MQSIFSQTSGSCSFSHMNCGSVHTVVGAFIVCAMIVSRQCSLSQFTSPVLR